MQSRELISFLVINALSAFALGAAAIVMLGLISLVQLFEESYINDDE